MIDPSLFGKGAIPTPESVKSDHFVLAAAPPPVINWHKPRRNRFLPVMNQHQTSSCVAHATVQYGRYLNYNSTGKIETYSVRDIYSQGWIPPEGGMYIWKGLNIPINNNRGFMSEASIPVGDYSENTLRDASLNSHGVCDALPKKYAALTNNHDMDYLAWVIDTFGGFVTGFNGSNSMFSPDGTVHIPSQIDWGHCVYAYDYGLNANNEKVITFLNSWTDGWGDKGYGYFPENFVKSGYMFDLYTYASIDDIEPTSMNNRLVQVQGNKDVWLVRNGQRSKISNALAFQIISGEWDKIEKISQDQLNAIPDSGNELLGWEQD